MVCERQTCRPLDWTPGLPSKDTKSLHVTICSKSGPSITIISVVLILACFVSDWAVAAKWETREQETYLCQWQDRGSGVVSMCVLLSSLYLHCWKEISADHTYTAFASDPTLIDLLLCSVQMQNGTICHLIISHTPFFYQHPTADNKEPKVFKCHHLWKEHLQYFDPLLHVNIQLAKKIQILL